MAAPKDSELEALARALLANAADAPRPLADLIAEFPEAADQLMDALLAMPAPTSPEPRAPDPASSPARATGAVSSDDTDGERHESATRDPDAGRRLGKYRIDGRLGRGGQAVVFAATDTELGRKVALKVLQADVFRTQFREQRFRAEAATTSRLDHPGVCPVYEIGEDGDHLYLAMRHVEGHTLAELIGNAKSRADDRDYTLELATDEPTAMERTEAGTRHLRPWRATLRLFESIAEALHSAHEAGITHRDVKPGNLMVQPDGTGVVLDFGLAADDLRDGITLTQSGDVFGTPSYMAPEQCRGEPVGPTADIWALGATFYEAITGERAFGGPNQDATIRQILNGHVPDPRRIVRGLPREFSIVVGKAMDPNPARRYPTAAAFAADLRRMRELHPILAEPPSLLLRTVRFTQRNPWWFAMAGVLVVAAVIGTALAGQAAASARENNLMRMREELATLQSEYDRLQPIAAHVNESLRWRERAETLIERRRDALALRTDLRQTGRPSGSVRLAKGIELERELDRLERVRRAVADGLGRPDTLEKLRARAVQDRERATALRQELDALRRWHFADPRDQLLHDSCDRYLADLDRFRDPGGSYRKLLRELASLDTAEVSWDRAIAQIAERYDGLQIAPQPGLQPLGVDPDSGLYEFAHLRSGTPPRRNEQGHLVCNDATGIVFVLLPGGPTWIGAQRTNPNGHRYDDRLRDTENYLVEVPLAPFLIAKHETTRRQWTHLGGSDNSFWPVSYRGTTLRHPIDQVSWEDATDVLARSGLTLPTEAQWEYAARAVEHREQEVPLLDTEHLAENLFDASAQGMSSIAERLTGSDGFVYTAPVGSFAANGFGLFDMRGNLREWCLDNKAYPDRHVMQPNTGEWLAPRGTKHGVRGHGYLNDLSLSPITARTHLGAYELDVGVRAVRLLDPGTGD